MLRAPEARWIMADMLAHAARGAGKVDLAGGRGATLVTLDEVEAMAGALVMLGLVPALPGRPMPATLLVPPLNINSEGDPE